VACVGMGSALVTDKIVKEEDWASLTQKVKTTIEIIGKLKPKPTGK